jgi:hypothetical protein
MKQQGDKMVLIKMKVLVHIDDQNVMVLARQDKHLSLLN